LSGSDQLYVLRVIATADPGSTGIVGERHALIVLVRGDTTEEAKQAALEGLRRRFWGSPHLEEVSPLSPGLGVSKTVEDAISDAAVHGFSLIVFNDPIPKH
jgi:hypothetical protein